MHRRLVVSTIAIVMVVLGALAVPVGLIVRNSAQEQLVARVEQQAAEIANRLGARPPGDELDIDAITLGLGPSDGLQLTDADGAVLLEVPITDDDVRYGRATAPDGTRVTVIASVRELNDDVRSQLQILIWLALGGIAAAAGLAAVQGHQLARPLERLARRASRIGAGDFSRNTYDRTHIPEIDGIGAALDTAAARVDRLLAAERQFTADATHQLRTGLTGVSLQAELLTHHGDPNVTADAQTIIDQTDQLNRTIDELLAVARHGQTTERSRFDLAPVVSSHADEWRSRYQLERRRIAVRIHRSAVLTATKGLVGQVLDIVLDNSLRHGAGVTSLVVDGTSVTITDEGLGVTTEQAKTLFDGPVDPAAQHGRGLSLARRLVQVDGGTLELTGPRPLTLRISWLTEDDEHDLAVVLQLPD